MAATASATTASAWEGDSHFLLIEILPRCQHGQFSGDVYYLITKILQSNSATVYDVKFSAIFREQRYTEFIVMKLLHRKRAPMSKFRNVLHWDDRRLLGRGLDPRRHILATLFRRRIAGAAGT